VITKFIFQSRVGAVINGGFSHRSSVLPDVNALRNPQRQHVPTVVLYVEKRTLKKKRNEKFDF
jgi:hypothetical protein